MKLKIRVNGLNREVDAEPMRRLLDVLREDLGLTGTKEGCGEGECGACSVLIDGRLVNSCLQPVAGCEHSEITTIEGLAARTEGKVLARSFAEAHGVQCGFCTPGMLMAADALLTENPSPSEDEIRLGISGNLCRCTGYDMIVDAIMLAAERLRDGVTDRPDAPDGTDAGER